MVLADCADDEACSFLTVSTTGPEVVCDFYPWTRNNFACVTSDQVSCRRPLCSFSSGLNTLLCSRGGNQVAPMPEDCQSGQSGNCSCPGLERLRK